MHLDRRGGLKKQGANEREINPTISLMSRIIKLTRTVWLCTRH